MKKPIKLKLNDLVSLEGRLYRVSWTKWSNGKLQGNKALLKLLDENEINRFLNNVLEGGK